MQTINMFWRVSHWNNADGTEWCSFWVKMRFLFIIRCIDYEKLRILYSKPIFWL